LFAGTQTQHVAIDTMIGENRRKARAARRDLPKLASVRPLRDEAGESARWPRKKDRSSAALESL
jgi:hypothetical protein